MSRSEGHIHSPARPLEPLRSVFESSEGSRRPTVNIAKALHLGLNAIYFTSQRHCVITQPDHESGNQRIRTLFGRMMCARTASRASQRKPQPKFFKQHRGFAGSLVVSKSLYITDAYAWRRGRDSNPRYGCPYAAFRVRCDRPLCHLSVAASGANSPSVGRYLSKAARRDKGAAASSSVRLIRFRRSSDLGPSCSHAPGPSPI